MIKEGEVGNTAFLIKEGECNVLSTRNPLLDAPKSKRHLEKKTDLDLRTVRGYMSPTTNKYNFGILEKNQWVGEERLLKKEEEPFDYTVIARTKVRAFSITKQEAQKKFPKEFMDFVEKEVMQRYKWIEQRAEHLAKTSKAVANMDPFSLKYDENLIKISRKYPTASTSVLTNIRKHEIITRSASPVKSVFQSGATISLMPLPMIKAESNNSSPKNGGMPSTKFEQLNKSVERVSNPSTRASPGRTSGSLTERLMQGRDKYKVEIASATPVCVDSRGMVPYFNKPLYKSRIAVLGSMRVLPTKIQYGLYNKQGDGEDEVKNFQVGNKMISIIEKNANKRTNTPNPFDAWHSQVTIPKK